jgi:phospholipase/lecithinase/hemolysin
MFRKVWGFLVLAMLAPAAAGASPITSLVVFGDSLSDQGNAFLMTGGFPPAPYDKRASNGPVAVERLAANLGVPLAPAVLGGTNYAVVGATTGPVVIPKSSPSATTQNIVALNYGQSALNGTSLLSQVGEFLATGPVTDPSGSLFFVWAGANDLLVNASINTISHALVNMTVAIGALYADGARRFLVPNLPDLSLTPFGMSAPALQPVLRALSVVFNTGLDAALDGLSGALPGIEIQKFDTFALLTALSADPGAFGLADATNPCLAGAVFGAGPACSNPGSDLFWDTLHLTSAGHGVLGDRFALAVPEPATIVLLGFGTGIAALSRRRRTSSRS